MADTPLDKIDGVGESRAESLRDAGYATAEAVATAPLEDLADVLGPAANIEEIRSNALDATGESDDEPEPDQDRSENRILSIPDREAGRYVVKGLIDESLRLRGRNKIDEAEHANELIERVLDETATDDPKIAVDLDDLSILYTAVRNLEQEFQRTRGLDDPTGIVRNIRIDVQDLRSDLWPDDEE